MRRIHRPLPILDGVSVSLSAPSKMPCYSWSLPAVRSCPASKATIERYGSDAVCVKCYARGGFYLMPSTVNALDVRFRFIRMSLATDGGSSAVETLVAMVRESVTVTGEPYFRVHDSGDFFSVGYISVWYRVAKALPDVRFWAPTRSHLVDALLDALTAFAELPNVTLRPSMPVIDEMPVNVPSFAASTAVHHTATRKPVGAKVCPATVGDPKCNAHGCRACWDLPKVPIIYLAH